MENKKEAILDNPMNIAVEIWDMTNPMVTANMNKTSYLVGCCEGLKYSRNHESSASQNSELKKENERLAHIIDEIDFKLSMMEDYAHGEVGNEITRLRKTISELLGGKTINKITQLQSTIDEKNKEIGYWHENQKEWREENSKLKKEIERLKGLLIAMFKFTPRYNDCGSPATAMAELNRFKTENNL